MKWVAILALLILFLPNISIAQQSTAILPVAPPGKEWTVVEFYIGDELVCQPILVDIPWYKDFFKSMLAGGACGVISLVSTIVVLMKQIKGLKRNSA